MELFHRMRDYFIPEEFEIHVYQNQIHIMNFTSIGEIGSEKILIRYENGMVVVKGNNLVLSKLLNGEVLIKGVLKTIEFR